MRTQRGRSTEMKRDTEREGDAKECGREEKGTREKLGDGKGERGGSECLMGSGGVYRSARQRRLFHLVIQLSSHLLDVVSPCEDCGRTLRPPMRRRRVALQNIKVRAPWERRGERERWRERDPRLQTGKMESFCRFICGFIHKSTNRCNLEVVTFSRLHTFFHFCLEFSGCLHSCYWKMRVHLVVN